MDSTEHARDEALRALQMEQLAGLKELRRVCRENGLRYYLSGGTLLGAVRHHGFIPWDDDMDVTMPREDYERLIRLCGEHALGPEYYVQAAETDETYPHYFAKLRRGPARPYAELTDREEGCVDIFPLDKCPDGKALGQFYFGWMHVLNNAILYHTERGFVCRFRHRYLFPLWRVVRHLSVGRLRAMRNALRKAMDALSSGRRLCAVCGVYGYPREVREASWFDEPAEMEFEGERFSVPSGWDPMLTNMFGDYMSPPPEGERHGHFQPE